MPVNEKSVNKKVEFIKQLRTKNIILIEKENSRNTLFKAKHNIVVYVRTTTKEDKKIWYDISENVLNEVNYLIYQTTSKYNFVLFPKDFFLNYYDELKDSNRAGAKIFYIDWYNDSGEKLISGDFSIDIGKYCCSTNDEMLYGDYSVLQSI